MKKRDMYFDDGLILRVRGASSSWVFRYTAPSGRRREMGLGAADLADGLPTNASLDAARTAHSNASKLLAERIDPIDKRAIDDASLLAEARRIEEAANSAKKRRAYWTLGRCARAYHERAIEPSRSAKHAAQWISSLENHMPAETWNKPIAQVTSRELLDAVLGVQPDARNRRKGADLAETKIRLCQRIYRVFADAIFNGILERNEAFNLSERVAEHAARRKLNNLAALSYPMAPALFRRIQRDTSIAALALEFAMLTVARTGEVLGARWSEINLDESAWTIPAERMKGIRRHVVHLTARALEVLELARGLHSDFVFPSPVKDGNPLSNMAMLNVLGRLGVRAQTTVHGLCRATFSTWANETGAARPEVIEACLAHEKTRDVRAYNRADYLGERAVLLQRWADFLQGDA